MAFATKSGLTALIALVDAIPTVQGDTNRGVPESFPSLVSAYVAVGLPTVVRETAGGLVRLDSVYFVGFGYAIEGAEQTAEDALADTLDAFVRAIETDPKVSGSFEQVRIAPPGAGSPMYETVVGQEHRHVRFTLEAQMRETIVRTT